MVEALAKFVRRMWACGVEAAHASDARLLP